MKIFCVGRNYSEHAKELNNEIPEAPVIFMKPPTAILKGKDFYIPEFSSDVHYECELIFRVCKNGKHIEPQFAGKYRLIVCNPPYFLPEQGKHSPSDFKNRCRFFLDSSFDKLIESINQSLAMDGEAFLLLRDLEDHGLDLLADLQKLIRGKLKCENLCMIRGTFLLKLYR